MKLRFLFLLLFPALLTAQAIGLHPPKVNWRQIDTDSVKVIFPAGYEPEAQRVAKLAHLLQAEHNRSIGDQYYKFDLVLQTENITPNAYVGLAPFRSEFFTTPPQSFNQLGLTNWNDLLTIHEFRHVQQNANERRGITKLFSFLQGQYGWAVLSGIATPNWFSEGDAVVMETSLTRSGRGRLPAFFRELRAMESAGIRYTYAKTRNGSFKDFVPDHYRYGYLYSTYARREFGNDVWKNVLAEGAAYRSLLYPFSRALKRATGHTTKTLYTTALDDYRSQLQSQKKGATDDFTVLSPPHHEPANYRFPHPQEDGSIIALRTTYRRTAELVRIDPDQKVKVLTRIGFQREPYLSVNNGLAIWNETRQNPRYQNESFSDLILFDLNSRTKQRITRRGRFLSPSLSADRKRIVAVAYHPIDGTALVTMDARENPTIDTLLRAGGRTLFAWPVLSPDGQTVYSLYRQDSKLAILQKEIGKAADEAPKLLVDFSYELKDNLTIGPRGQLYFTSPRNGNDQIYRLDPASGAMSRITDHPLGAYFPGVGPAGELVFSSPTPSGLELSRRNAPLEIEAGLRSSKSTFTTYDNEGSNILDQPIDRADFPTKEISDHFGGIRLHSWSYNGSYVEPGVAVEATNALNTISMAADVSYNYNEARTGGGFNLRYGGFYPVMELAGRYRERSVLVGNPDFLDSLAVNRSDFNELELSAGLEVPLRWLDGNFVIELQPGLALSNLRLRNRSQLDERLPDDNFSLEGSLLFRLLERRALQQVQPRLGLSLQLTANGILGGADQGGRLLVRSSIFLPGLHRNHGLRLDVDVQHEQLLNPYQYSDRMQYVRGFYAPLNDRAVRLGVNYQLPLLYPDFGIAGITYFKRIRLNAFFDTGSFGLDVFDRDFEMRSAGGEVFFDNVWLNTQDITVGLQAAYRLTTDFFAPLGESDLRLRVLVEGSF
ncbi:hypothetical protein CEQ90_07110 [Lewinellaceae bacterium SD302]|nr:hypothetical protein CEQ90_07110 [Lewinellaceae bacterium SD302]